MEEKWARLTPHYNARNASRPNAWYGWRPDKPDARDHMYQMPLGLNFVVFPSGGNTPPKPPAPPAPNAPVTSVDLRSQCPPVYDQLQLGSCTSNAICAAYEFDLKRQKLTDFMPSRLEHYYNERVLEGTAAYDAGAEIRDGIKVLAKQGVCTERTWPYVISNFATKPPQAAYTEGLKHLAVSYQRIDNTNLAMLKARLIAGFPVVFGFSVYDSFESATVARTGIVPMPKPSESLLGGHAVLAVGFDDAKQMFLVRNSWGTSWGLAGYFWISYSYLTNLNLADDFWTIELVKG